MATHSKTRRKAPSTASADAPGDTAAAPLAAPAPARARRTVKAGKSIATVEAIKAIETVEAVKAVETAETVETGTQTASAPPARPTAARKRDARTAGGEPAALPSPQLTAAAPAEVAAGPASLAQRPPRRKRQAPALTLAADTAEATDLPQAVLQMLGAPARPAKPARPQAPAPQRGRRPAAVTAAAPAPAPEAAAPAPAPAAVPLPQPVPDGPADSAIRLLSGDAHRVVWQPGTACPAALRALAAQHVDSQQGLAPDDDTALPQLLRAAQLAGHPLAVDPAVWPYLAAHRDARNRLALLESAYPAGPASPALVGLLKAPLAGFQAEGALFAVVAGRALLADERGLGKSVQAIAAATLWQRHFGVQRVLLVCAAAEVAAWQRAWRRFAPPAQGGLAPQHMDGGLHQRQALWSQPAGLRILSPEALASDAAHLQQWSPDLVIVDEPQRLGLRPADWAALAAPQALVLCGAPLAEQAGLMDALVAWLDDQRLGPLAALRELQAAVLQGRPLEEAEIERLTHQLSRLMLQRSRQDVAAQLPAVVHSERLLAMAPGQREAHGAALAQVRLWLAAWQRSGYLADADQWRLAQALQALQQAALRAQPGQADSALADAVVQALAAQIEAWAGCTAGPGEDGAGFQARLLCPSDADHAQLSARLVLPDGIALARPGDAWPAGLDAVVQLGVPWRSRRAAVGADPGAGQQWVSLVAQDSLDAGLFDTLALRPDLPRSLADGGRGFLQGDALQRWLQAVQAAVDAVDAAGSAGPAGA